MAKKILKAGLSIGGGLLGNLVGKAIFGSGKKKEAKPEPATPVMPTPDDEAIARARRKSIVEQMQRGGRQSTILTDSSETLGG